MKINPQRKCLRLRYYMYAYILNIILLKLLVDKIHLTYTVYSWFSIIQISHIQTPGIIKYEKFLCRNFMQEKFFTWKFLDLGYIQCDKIRDWVSWTILGFNHSRMIN